MRPERASAAPCAFMIYKFAGTLDHNCPTSQFRRTNLQTVLVVSQHIRLAEAANGAVLCADLWLQPSWAHLHSYFWCT